MTGTARGIVGRLRAAGCVFAEEEASVLTRSASSVRELESMLARRVAGEPLEYVVGWASFCGLRIVIEAGVFVPRPRTSYLVSQAVRLAPRGAVVLDLCCGSGALGAAVLAALPEATLYAADVDPVAVRVARRNLSCPVFEGDLFTPVPGYLAGRLDLIVANVPYVPSSEVTLMPAEARDHEPRAALDGGQDGLDVVRRVAAEGAGWLAPGGHLLVEAGEHQTAPAVEAFGAAGLRASVAHDDELGATVVIGSNIR